ncbi:MAG: antibiotic biosynthesis monooxygenase [Pseudonocardiales bacterium]|nr:MAG: antibiotic biosynthesis monooxygenase [Pseudonocardiales bacterium]
MARFVEGLYFDFDGDALSVVCHRRAGAADAVRELLARHAAASCAEPGCLQFDAHQGIGNPDEFALVERYESQAAFAEHRRTRHFRRNVETELVVLLTAHSWTVFGPAL